MKFTFYKGACVPDPDGVFNAELDGKQWRSVEFHKGDEIREAELKKLIRAAIDNNLAK